MGIKIFLKIFFTLPVWFLRLITFQRNTIVNNQILDFQTQIFLSLQALQANTIDDPDSLETAEELREKLEGGREGLPLNAKPSQPIKIIDHVIKNQSFNLKIREYCPEKLKSSNAILYFHGGGYIKRR